MYVRQIFGGSTPQQYLTDVVPSNIWGVYIPKYLTDVCPSHIWGVYTAKLFDGYMSVKHLGGVHPQNIERMWFHQIFGGSTPHIYLKDVVLSNIWGFYTPKIFDGCCSVKYLGGLRPPKYLTDVCPSNISGVYTPKIFDGCGSVKYLGGLHPQNI